MEKRTERPSRVRTAMDTGNRAKIFAPFEALGPMGDMLEEVENSIHIGELEHVREPDEFPAGDAEIWTDLN